MDGDAFLEGISSLELRCVAAPAVAAAAAEATGGRGDEQRSGRVAKNPPVSEADARLG